MDAETIRNIQAPIKQLHKENSEMRVGPARVTHQGMAVFGSENGIRESHHTNTVANISE